MDTSLTDDRNNLTEGPIVRKLLLFFLPIAAGNLFQLLYSAVDAFVVGKYVGTEALAAVGGSPSIVSSLIIGFCTSLGGGASVVISQACGAKQDEKVTAAIKSSYIFSILLGALVGAIVVFLSPQILTVLKTPEDTMADALAYQQIYFVGAVFLLVYNMGSGILRAVGDSRFPFICLCVSCVINIILDVVFVAAFGFGVAGAAWATVIAQGVCAIMVTVKLLIAEGSCRLTFRGVPVSFPLLRQMLKIGVPAGLQNSMYGVSNMILQVGINTVSTVAIAAWAMSGKIDGVFWACTGAFGTALTAFVGQNYGARDIARVKEATKKGFILFQILTVILCAGILLLAQPILHLINDDIAVIETTWEIMLFFVPAYVVWVVIEVYSATLRGIGDVVVPAIILGIGICLVRIVWVATVFRSIPELWVLCACYPISWAITAVAIFIYYKHKEKSIAFEKPAIPEDC